MRLLRLAVLPLFAALVVTPARSDDAKPPEGFTALFNGKDLTGWKATGKADVWEVEDGAIVVEKGGGGWLLTEKEYGDFELRLEYKLSARRPTAASPCAPRTKGDPAYVGMEIQLIDDEGWPGKLADYQHTGSIYDVVPAAKTNNKPIGEWNAIRIVCKGRRSRSSVNGKTLVDANLDDYEGTKFAKHPGLAAARGTSASRATTPASSSATCPSSRCEPRISRIQTEAGPASCLRSVFADSWFTSSPSCRAVGTTVRGRRPTHSDVHPLSGNPGALKSAGRSFFLVVRFLNSQMTWSLFGCWNQSRAGSIHRSANFGSLLFFHRTSSALLNSSMSSLVFGRTWMCR